MHSDKKHVMVDVETMGQSAGSALVSLSGVVFEVDGSLGDSFHRVIDLASCMTFGLRIEPSTVYWWLDQGQAARDGLKGGQNLIDVLRAFSEWYPKDAYFWGYGATFDPPLLEMAYKAIGMPIPWHYRKVRCARTVMELAGVKYEVMGTVHNSLDDARAQAKGTAEALRILGPKPDADARAELRYYVNNPSAWQAFDQTLSDLIARLVR